MNNQVTSHLNRITNSTVDALSCVRNSYERLSTLLAFDSILVKEMYYQYRSSHVLLYITDLIPHRYMLFATLDNLEHLSDHEDDDSFPLCTMSPIIHPF